MKERLEGDEVVFDDAANKCDELQDLDDGAFGYDG